jgi:transposase-like protein
VFGSTREQRCWAQDANVLNKLPKHLQPKAKSDLHQIWMAATRDDAHRAFAAFVQTYEPKYPKAAECLAKDRNALLAFYDFPAAHWIHLRTTNPIESTFATVRLRTVKSRGCGSRASCRRCSNSRKARSNGGEPCVAPNARQGHHRSSVQKRGRSAEEGPSEDRRLITSPYTTLDSARVSLGKEDVAAVD